MEVLSDLFLSLLFFDFQVFIFTQDGWFRACQDVDSPQSIYQLEGGACRNSFLKSLLSNNGKDHHHPI
jgi:hypothetical protein